MKTKAKYFLVSLLMFMQFSCNDWMELYPPAGLIKEEYWKSKEDVESVLMAAYESFAALNRLLFVHGEVRGDMVVGDNNQPNNEELIAQGNIYPDNSLTNWQNFYKVINYANEVIKNAPLVLEIDQTFNEFQMTGYVAEAYFIRSLTYFYLVRIYKDVPLILEPSESDNVNFFVEKSTEAEILSQIVQDLENNRQYAPAIGYFPTIEENKGRASKAAYDALLADIALWQFDYDAVIQYVDRIYNPLVVSDENPQQFFLMPAGLWFELFEPGNSLESIFEVQYDQDRGQRNDTYNITIENRRQYDPSVKAIEMFSFDFAMELVRGENASIRRYSETDFIIWKYVGLAADGRSFRSGSSVYSANWIVYRVADLLLMKAEALSQLERFPEALEIINEIRARADMPPVAIANDRVAYEDAILEERAAELAFEGKRWFDLLRMGRRNDYARKSELINIIIENVPSTQKRILAAKLTNPNGWYMPIYEREIERNLNLVQNPYYNN
jgi:starch-binding outer membrane protein, SusD/RagB family